jgi:NAD+ kinase
VTVRARGKRPPRKRVLIIYKKSAYQRLGRTRRAGRVEELLARNDRSVSRLMAAHDDHLQSIEAARAILEKLDVRPVFRYRSDANRAEEFDLVVTLGGDGTLLWASHLVGHQPMVAINTAPQDSVGYFCAGTKNNLEETLVAAVDGSLGSTKLTRMQIELDGEIVSSRVLNDVLFCHECPAATTRYILGHRDAEEEHKSSGLWIGPAAGSTAAQRSAGGKILPPSSKRLQYVVREPYEPAGVSFSLKRGLIEPGESLSLTSKIDGGRLYVDGPHVRREVELGGKIVLQRSQEPLTVLGFRARDRS